MSQVNLNSLLPNPSTSSRFKAQPQVNTPQVSPQTKAPLEKTQQLVDSSIRHQLDEVLAKYGIKADKIDAQEFTPDKVSERILGFVQLGLQRAKASGADDAKLQSLFDAARSGIEQGFKEAKEILTGLQQFQGKVEQDANQTLKLLNEGMDKLSDSWFGQTQTASPTSVKAAEFGSFEQQNRLSLQIQTKDGDKISLSFNQSSAAYQATSYQQNTDGLSLNRQQGRAASAAFDIQIEGDLSESEQQALASLIEQVQGVSDRFFGDDLPGAFKAATELGFDSSQLAGFSLDLQRSQTSRYAQSYQQSTTPSPLKALIDTGNRFVDSFSQPQLDALLDSPRQTATQLLEQLTQHDSRFTELSSQLQQQAQAALAELTGGFTDALLALRAPNQQQSS